MYNFIVPQELSIQDRIGNYTLPQLGFLAGGMLLIMTMLTSNSMPIWVTILVGIPIFIFCVSMAFVKVYHMPLYEYLMVLAMYKAVPKECIYSATEYEGEDYELDKEFEDNFLIF